MKKIIKSILMFLGVIFVIQIILLSYFIIADPFGIKPFIFGSSTNSSNNGSETTETSSNSSAETTENSLLSPDQKKTLEKFGVDPATVPDELSAEQEECFIEKLGEQRVNEIKEGDSPSAVEFFKAKECI